MGVAKGLDTKSSVILLVGGNVLIFYEITKL